LDWECSDALPDNVDYPHDEDAVSHYILHNYVLNKAAEYTNSRIELFLNLESEPIDEDTDINSIEHKIFGCQLCMCEDPTSAWNQIHKHIATLVDKSHFGLDVMACPSCGQYFLKIFTEFTDFNEGNDLICGDMLPITEEEAARLINDGNKASHEYIESIGSNRRHLTSNSIYRRWADGGLRVEEGH